MKNKEESVLTIMIILCLTSLFIERSLQQKMLGKADVEIKSIEECPDSESDRYHLSLTRRKLNRTMEGWSGNITFDIFIGEGIEMHVNVYQEVDGGYKNVYVLNDSNVCDFVMKHAANNFKSFLISAGAEPECPIPPGKYTIVDYPVDTESFDTDILYGEFRVDTQLYREGVRIFCIRVYITSKPKKSTIAGYSG